MITPADVELYESLKELPDFSCYPLPKEWYAHFKIPLPETLSVKDFINSGYTMKCQFATNDSFEDITEPQDGGRLLTIPKPPEIEVIVESKPLKDAKDISTVPREELVAQDESLFQTGRQFYPE